MSNIQFTDAVLETLKKRKISPDQYKYSVPVNRKSIIVFRRGMYDGYTRPEAIIEREPAWNVINKYSLRGFLVLSNGVEVTNLSYISQDGQSMEYNITEYSKEDNLQLLMFGN
jgi:hypothetical protein